MRQYSVSCGGLSSAGFIPVRDGISMITIKYKKGIWWMPWRQEAMKDVIGCEKPRGAANRH
uniref:Uncharacterized protein n=1 Tax=uncultured Rhodospirillales bacterium HF4000_24M03 TaxID=710788 RepID=E0XW23_9PROT|nr:hypothetical protein [uncultured Rhodospirillales bacterium HF4000_24M03]